jgi:hypothetical protein
VSHTSSPSTFNFDTEILMRNQEKLMKSEEKLKILTISEGRNTFLQKLRGGDFTTERSLFEYIDEYDICVTQEQAEQLLQFRRNGRLDDSFGPFVKEFDERSSVKTGEPNISKLRRHHVQPGTFILKRWQVSSEDAMAFFPSELYDQYLADEIAILNKYRSALAYCIYAKLPLQELDHVQKMYILYKTGFLSRLFQRSKVPHAVSANELILKAKMGMVTNIQDKYDQQLVSGSPDVVTGNIPNGNLVKSLRQIRTIEELKNPNTNHLRCAAAGPKDQSLFQTACLAAMRRSNVAGSDLFFSCLTDFFSIRISAVRRSNGNEQPIHYLAPRAIEASDFIVYQLLIHLMDDKTVDKMSLESGDYAESCTGDENGSNDGGVPEEDKPDDGWENDDRTVGDGDDDEEDEDDRKPSANDPPASSTLALQLDRSCQDSDKENASINFKEWEEVEEYQIKVREMRDWSAVVNGFTLLTAENLKKVQYPSSK